MKLQYPSDVWVFCYVDANGETQKSGPQLKHIAEMWLEEDRQKHPDRQQWVEPFQVKQAKPKGKRT